MSNLRKEFGKIYDQHIEKIFRFIFLKVNSQEIAEDLTSEVFTRGWESFQRQNVQIKNVQAFLYQIARNLIVDHYRTKAKVQFVSTEYVQLDDPDVQLEEKASFKSDLDIITASLSDLRDEYREMITWYYIDELSVPEIAKMQRKSEEAIRVTIHRALQALKAEIGDKEV